MIIKGCLLSKDGQDKVLVATELAAKDCEVRITDKSGKSLVRSWYSIEKGRVYLYVENLNRLGSPVTKRLIAIL